MSGSRLEIRGVTRRFDRDRVTALDAVDVEVEAGRSTVVLGQSGSGKSTLLRIVAGLMRADAGEVVLGGTVLSDPAIRVAPEKRRIGMVFQALELWPHMTVAEHIAFGLPGRPRGRAAAAHETVGRLAEEVGLASALLSRRPDTLSGGERQRVAIARTLAPEPAVILFDEPLASLDPDRRASLRQLIRRVAAQHETTVLYVTHDATEAVEMGDEIVVLEQGRVVERADPETLYRRPSTLAGARALGAVNALDATLTDDRVQTALGEHARAAAPESAGSKPLLALIRPEHVVLGEGGVAAEIEQAHVHGAGWRFVARVGEASVEGRADRRVAPGEAVALRVDGPAVVVLKEQDA
ncbi:MAG: ABC transporter ATP-binding protein [Planctomycetota bacterium]|nr:ABC transporter ATP-binding protein [Planctomycetota bacterium]